MHSALLLYTRHDRAERGVSDASQAIEDPSEREGPQIRAERAESGGYRSASTGG
jgi:hypothetical protein